LSKKRSKKEDYQYTPEEAALLMRRRIFIRLKWFAIGGVVVAILVASQVFHIGFPIIPVYIICAVMIAYNVFLVYQVRRLQAERPGLIIQKARTYGYINKVFDLAALTAILHFTGGIENPFIFYFVFHIIIASIILHYRTVYLLATSALMMVILLVGLEYAGVIPHNNLEGFAAPELYRQRTYIVAILVALATILYATAYMASAISGELRKRQREVVELRESLLAEKTGQLEQASIEIAKLEEERNRFLRFIGIAAHDLKAPLTAIQGFLWVMLGGFSGELNDKQKNMLARSTHRISELLNLISDLLDIPRIETGQVVQEMKVISLPEIIKGSCDELLERAEEKGIKLKVELPTNLPMVQGSIPRLQQVMTNLVTNAINYTSEGEITVRIIEENNDIKVEVMDTGMGIPPQELLHIFDDFFRASNVETRGTGLGLSISKRIIEAHGGSIYAESPCSESNTGSKFTFTLPKKVKTKRRQR